MSARQPSAAPTPGQVHPPREVRRARAAVSSVFLLNGLSFCAIVPRFPEIRDGLAITNAELGLAVALGAFASLIVGLLAAPVMAKIGSAKAAIVFQILASSAHLLIYIAPSWWWLAIGFMIATGVDTITDVAQNTHGMRVERRYGRSIMNSYHGFWSLGAVLGGVIGAACAQFAVPLGVQGAVGLVVLGIASAINYPNMLKGPDTLERNLPEGLEDRGAEQGFEVAGPTPASAQVVPVGAHGDASAEITNHGDRSEHPDPREHGTPQGKGASAGKMPPGRTKAGLAGILACLGMILVFAGSTEDAGNTWGALFMTDTFHSEPFVAGLAFVALQGTQMTARFLGDAIVNAWGDRKTARVGACIAFAGMSLAMLIPHPVTAIAGFAAAGWGVATLFPAVFRAGDDLEGLKTGVGITVVGWFARLGFLVTPPLVGWIADLVTLRYALWAVPIYALGILAFSGALEGKREAAPAATSPSA